ncbi:hypothetical protein JCM2811A_39660 [Methylorubrum rhodinum]
MFLDAKDVFLIFIGFALNLAAAAVYTWWGARSQKAKATSEENTNVWKRRINSKDINDRTDAFFEIIIRSFYWLIVGNMLFAASGLAWVLDLTGIDGFQSVFASATSFIALFFFWISLKWLRMYFKLKTSI